MKNFSCTFCESTKFQRKAQINYHALPGGIQELALKNVSRDFPGCPGLKNLPSSAGAMGSGRGQGSRILHAMGQLSPCAAREKYDARHDRRCHVL